MPYLKLHSAHFASAVIIAILPLIGLAQEKGGRNTPRKNVPKMSQELKDKHAKNNNFYFCKAIDPNDIQKPKITVTNVKQSSSLQGGKYKAKGIIEGVCLKEAGLYENGERIVKFSLETSPSYTRVDFEFEVNYDNSPEVRAFDINWQRGSVMLLKNVKRKNS